MTTRFHIVYFTCFCGNVGNKILFYEVTWTWAVVDMYWCGLAALLVSVHLCLERAAQPMHVALWWHEPPGTNTSDLQIQLYSTHIIQKQGSQSCVQVAEHGWFKCSELASWWQKGTSAVNAMLTLSFTHFWNIYFSNKAIVLQQSFE